MAKTILDDLKQRYMERLDALTAGSSGVFGNEAAALRAIWEGLQPDANAEDIAELIQQSRRVEMIFAAGQRENEKLQPMIEQHAEKAWQEIPSLPLARKNQIAIANNMSQSIDLTPENKLIISCAPGCKHMTEHMIERCLREGRQFDVEFREPNFEALLLDRCDEEQAASLGKWFNDSQDWSTSMLFFRSTDPNTLGALVDKDRVGRNAGIRDAQMSPVMKKRMDDTIRWCLTYLPTEKEAAIDGMEYEDYLTLFSELCDQPWKQLEAAQGNLVQAFDRCEAFRATNEDGTDISMSIKGFEFANSVVGRNLPGCEIFSSPKCDSVNGTIVAKGKFQYDDLTGVIEDLSLTFKDGKLVDYDAAKNKEGFERFLKLHPECYRLGELGIGCNPWLRQHVINGLLVEKIGGSFHVAFGESYRNQYAGKPINMNNGNKADGHHWDITTMLRGKEGKMYLTDEQGKEHLVQDNGEWQAVPELGIEQQHVDILNKGWEAVKEQEGDHALPRYWRDKLAAQENSVMR